MCFHQRTGPARFTDHFRDTLVDYANFLIQFNGANEKTRANLDSVTDLVL